MFLGKIYVRFQKVGGEGEVGFFFRKESIYVFMRNRFYRFVNNVKCGFVFYKKKESFIFRNI